ncbi:MAG: hypothetical protein FDZ69_14060 [Deltaproteobacteria bacterium]|nr:MAG: hypothetical protein FDZ69_14060 [Deltaproteobacteria bacterium]
MNEELFSIRMRAEHGGGHCCGAERIAPAEVVPALAAELVARALAGGAAPDTVHCSIERLPGVVPRLRLPAWLLYTSDAADEEASRDIGGARVVEKQDAVCSSGPPAMQRVPPVDDRQRET